MENDIQIIRNPLRKILEKIMDRFDYNISVCYKSKVRTKPVTIEENKFIFLLVVTENRHTAVRNILKK